MVINRVIHTGLQAADIPVVRQYDGKVMHIVSGTWEGVTGFVNRSQIFILLRLILRKAAKEFGIPARSDRISVCSNADMYVNGEDVTEHYIVEFSHDGNIIELEGIEQLH